VNNTEERSAGSYSIGQVKRTAESLSHQQMSKVVEVYCVIQLLERFYIT